MTYEIKTLGIHVKSESPKVLLLLPVVALALYLIGCVTLWSFVQLFGISEFTWVNGVYSSFILAILNSIFSTKDSGI